MCSQKNPLPTVYLQVMFCYLIKNNNKMYWFSYTIQIGDTTIKKIKYIVFTMSCIKTDFI